MEKGIKILLSTDENGVKSYLCDTIAFENEKKKYKSVDNNKPVSKTAFEFSLGIYTKNTQLDNLVEKK